MILRVKEKDYKIKFGYKSLAKSGILRDVMKMQNLFGAEGSEVSDTEAFKILPELFDMISTMVLAGLQKYNEEFRVDYDNPQSVKTGIEKVYDFMDDYMDEPDSVELMELFSKLTGELFDNGFLSAKPSPKLEAAMTATDSTIVPMDHLAKAPN